MLDRIDASRFGRSGRPCSADARRAGLDPKRRRGCGTAPSGFLWRETRKKPDSDSDYGFNRPVLGATDRFCLRRDRDDMADRKDPSPWRRMRSRRPSIPRPQTETEVWATTRCKFRAPSVGTLSHGESGVG